VTFTFSDDSCTCTRERKTNKKLCGKALTLKKKYCTEKPGEGNLLQGKKSGFGMGNPKTRKPQSGIRNPGIRNPESGIKNPQIKENKFYKYAKII